MSQFKKLSILCILVCSAANLAAQDGGTLTVSCPKKPKTIRVISAGIREGVEARVNPDYANPKVRVRAKCRRMPGGEQFVFSLASLLDTVNIENSNHPSGLAYGVSGEVAIDFQGNACDYSCRVIITSSGNEPETGDRVNTRTESSLPVSEPLNGRFIVRK